LKSIKKKKEKASSSVFSPSKRNEKGLEKSLLTGPSSKKNIRARKKGKLQKRGLKEGGRNVQLFQEVPGPEKKGQTMKSIPTTTAFQGNRLSRLGVKGRGSSSPQGQMYFLKRKGGTRIGATQGGGWRIWGERNT